MLSIVFIIIALIMGLSLYSSYIAQKNAVIELMNHNSIQLSHTIEKASRNTVISYSLYIRKIKQKTYSDLLFISHVEKENHLSKKFINEFLKERQLLDIFIIDENRKLIFSSGTEKPPFLPINDLDNLIFGEKEKMDFGIIHNYKRNEKRIVIGIHRPGGGAIISTEKASHILNIQNMLNVNELLTTITTDSTIKYIAIQDTSSKIVYSTTNDSLSSITNDNFLKSVIDKKMISWRITSYNAHPILETVHYVTSLPRLEGVIRIGLDYAPIQQIQSNALHQASIRIIFLVFLGFVMIAYSITIQNNQILEDETQRVTNEITGLQKHLTQKEKLSAIGELAAGVAHKIRNPLNAISMTAQRLSSEFVVNKDAEEFQKLNTIVKKEITQISEIINQFLQFSRPEPICKVECSVNDIIKSVLDLYSPTTEKKNIATSFHFDEELKVFLDDDKIKQSLINLVENSIDAIGENGEISISLNSKRNNIIITLEDNGHGIDKNNLDKIFNLYFTTKASGTGIGLAQVYRVVSEHDGQINVSSQPGKGTTFTISLPRKDK